MTNAADTESPPHDDPEMDRRVTLLEAEWKAVVPTLATKVDLAELRSEMREEFSEVRTEMRAGFRDVRAEMQQISSELRAGMQQIASDLRTAIHQSSSELRAELHKGITETHRWMIATVIGLFLGVGGMFFALVNILGRLPAP